jgi:Ca2+-binding RTX toxin-like protein
MPSVRWVLVAIACAGAGNDRLLGMAGNDVVCGGGGGDLLIGGGGRNYCDQGSAGRAVSAC